MATNTVNKPPSAHPSRVHGNTGYSGGPSSDQHDPGLYTACQNHGAQPHHPLAGLSSTSMLHPHPLSTPARGPCPSPITPLLASQEWAMRRFGSWNRNKLSFILELKLPKTKLC
ncbi:hypothetical protein CesoFtcFv8_014487 [Champsocephalus esox]|uniref:Uncharacterized protein n=1 Tax=Champsocephalus esox TaxID=159716 RepID=A0AAN8BS59_9TELE|nr:hypothetical protein CesoFtcFv8_014487 [Champsocephalus esox]